MGFNAYLGEDSQSRLNKSYGDINTWYEKYQPKELDKLDEYLNEYNSDGAYRKATDRALAGLSSEMTANVLPAGMMPNLKAGASDIALSQSSAVGRTAVGAQLTQQQRYAAALDKVVKTGIQHKRLADYGLNSNQSMDETIANANAQAKQIKNAAFANLAGGLVGLGAGWLGGANKGLTGLATDQLNTALTTGDMAALQKWQTMPTSNAAWLGGKISSGWNSISDWAGGTSLGKVLSGGSPTALTPLNYFSPGQIQG